jgi:2-iminobutanoate/2-iminopropanoate deaminase
MTTPDIGHLVADGLTKPLPLYNHATIYNGIVYISAIQGFVPGTVDFPSTDPGDEARQVLANLKVVLDQAGSSLANVLKITVLMTDMTYFPRINEAINEAFPVNPPARSSIAVIELPKQAKVAIEAIAAVCT